MKKAMQLYAAACEKGHAPAAFGGFPVEGYSFFLVHLYAHGRLIAQPQGTGSGGKAVFIGKGSGAVPSGRREGGYPGAVQPGLLLLSGHRHSPCRCPDSSKSPNCTVPGRLPLRPPAGNIKAAAQDFPRAQQLLGECYENGYGVERDEERAFRLYQKSHENGHIPTLPPLAAWR